MSHGTTRRPEDITKILALTFLRAMRSHKVSLQGEKLDRAVRHLVGSISRKPELESMHFAFGRIHRGRYPWFVDLLAELSSKSEEELKLELESANSLKPCERSEMLRVAHMAVMFAK